MTTPNGPETLEVPRGRLVGEGGKSREFRSKILARYARRCLEVDEAILGAYLAGANSRRIRKALAPLLGEENGLLPTCSERSELTGAPACRALTGQARVLLPTSMRCQLWPLV